MKKILARQLTLKNIHTMAWKNSYKEFDNEKKVLLLENSPLRPPPPHNFSNGPSLTSNARTTAVSDCHIIDSDISCVWRPRNSLKDYL